MSISVQTETIYGDSVSLKRRQYNELKEGKMKKKEGERLEQEQVNHPYNHYRYYYFLNPNFCPTFNIPQNINT